MKQSQQQWAVEQLLANKRVSRNQALQHFITRLGAIICDLNKEGWVIDGKFEEWGSGKDYVYYLVRKPEVYPQATTKAPEQNRLGFTLPPILA